MGKYLKYITSLYSSKLHISILNYSGGPGPGPKPVGMPNEVEIVVTAKTGPLRQYAERIESRIKAQGLAVDVLFPREDIPIRKVLDDLLSRGTLYGIVLSPLNQEHGSITLNILFGQPEGKSLFKNCQ